MQSQFWGIGGEYIDTDFTRLADGTSQVFGPFSDYHKAQTVWREQSMNNRHLAMTRFTIAANAGGAK